jgi:hypothetical protein
MNSYHSSILNIHSILRYLVLLFAVIVTVQSLVGMMGKKPFKDSNRKMALILLICCDLQLVLGLLLYYLTVISTGMLSSGGIMKDTYKRFYAVEHSVSMIVAIILVHVGYSVTKKNIDPERKFKKLFWCAFIALGLFLAMIPWDGRQIVGRPNMPSFSMSF